MGKTGCSVRMRASSAAGSNPSRMNWTRGNSESVIESVLLGCITPCWDKSLDRWSHPWAGGAPSGRTRFHLNLARARWSPRRAMAASGHGPAGAARVAAPAPSWTAAPAWACAARAPHRPRRSRPRTGRLPGGRLRRDRRTADRPYRDRAARPARNRAAGRARRWGKRDACAIACSQSLLGPIRLSIVSLAPRERDSPYEAILVRSRAVIVQVGRMGKDRQSGTAGGVWRTRWRHSAMISSFRAQD
jgi:hypothetical protein